MNGFKGLRAEVGLTRRTVPDSFPDMLDEVRQRPRGNALWGRFRACPLEGDHTGNKGVEHMSSENKNSCVLVVPVCEAGRLEAQREEIAQTLNELAGDVRDLQEKIRSGEAKKQEVGAALADLRYWLKALRETEAELETIRRRDSGIIGGWGLDLEAAGDEVRCRLARLATCCGEG